MSSTAHINPHETGNAHSLWEPRRTLTLAAARRHSMLVRVFRLILLGLAAAAVGALVWEFSKQQEATFEPADPTQSVKMVNPRYSGRTEDGLPFFLTAKEAVRPTSSQQTVELIDPVLEFYRVENAAKSLVIAQAGTYNDVDKVLELRETVNLNTDDGYACKTTHARVYTKTKIIEGDEPINCTGEFGDIKGNAFEIRDDYQTYIFKKGMSAILETEE